MLRGHLLACKHGATLPRSFREASAKLPQTPSWLAVGICSSSKPRCVSCTQQHLFFYWNRFSELFHARTETFSCISATKLPQTFREQISSANLPHASARGAAHIFNNNVPLPTKLACGFKLNKRAITVVSLQGRLFPSEHQVTFLEANKLDHLFTNQSLGFS